MHTDTPSHAAAPSQETTVTPAQATATHVNQPFVSDIVNNLLKRRAHLQQLIADYDKWPPNPVWRANNELEHVNHQLTVYGWVDPPPPAKLPHHPPAVNIGTSPIIS